MKFQLPLVLSPSFHMHSDPIYEDHPTLVCPLDAIKRKEGKSRSSTKISGHTPPHTKGDLEETIQVEVQKKISNKWIDPHPRFFIYLVLVFLYWSYFSIYFFEVPAPQLNFKISKSTMLKGKKKTKQKVMRQLKISLSFLLDDSKKAKTTARSGTLHHHIKKVEM